MRALFTIVLFFLVIFYSQAQRNETQIDYPYYQFSDTLMIIESTISITDKSGDSLAYIFDPTLNTIQILDEYKRTPYTLTYQGIKKKRTISTSAFRRTSYDSLAVFSDVSSSNSTKFSSAKKNAKDLIGLNGLEIEGAFLRSVSGGDRQSARMHSVMDLSIKGELSDNLFLNARLTDQQMPFQPEGNTQRLQDFDRIKIELLHNRWAIAAGDLILNAGQSNPFFALNRNIQGIQLNTNALSFDSTNSTTSFTSAFSNSKWTSQVINPIEGVLGPYRLQGGNNESFIFVIAGSETVYLDGKLLSRGIDNDYIIDYNAAEITFTTNHYINKQSRIVVEFEYSDQQYNRSVNFLHHKHRANKLSIEVDYYSEKDNPYSSSYSLNQQDYQMLSDLDAQEDHAYIDAVDSTEFNIDKILYSRKDTLIGNNHYHYYQYSVNSDSELYQLNFSYVGEGRGNYVQSNSMANSVIYEWIAPVNGKSQGDYSPLSKINLPGKKRYINLGLRYELDNSGSIRFNYSISDTKNNLFSNGNSLKGNAFALGYSSPNHSFKKINWHYSIDYQRLDSAYNPIQNIRSTEYNRDWGFTDEASYNNASDQLLMFKNTLSYKKHRLTMHSNVRKQEFLGMGFQNKLEYNLRNQGLNIKLNYFNSSAEGDSIQHQWNRLKTTVYYDQLRYIPSYSFNLQQHKSAVNDSIYQSFNAFEEHVFGLTNKDTSQLKLNFNQAFRKDYLPDSGELRLSENSFNTQVKIKYQYGEQNQLGVNFTRRGILPTDSVGRQSFYQGALNWNQAIFPNLVEHQLHYQTGTGRVLERNYIFQQTANGLGTHSWLDLNDNDLRERNEFYEDQTEYGDRNFIKIFTIGNEYITAFTNSFNYTIQAKLPKLTDNSSSILFYLQTLNLRFNTKQHTKSTFNDALKQLNPFQFNYDNEKILHRQSFNHLSLNINRGRKLQASYNYQTNYRKMFLSEGFENRSTRSNDILITYNFINSMSFLLNLGNEYILNASDVVDNRDYTFSRESIEPQIQLFAASNWKIELSQAWIASSSLSEGNDQGVITGKTEVSSKFIDENNNLLEANFSYVSVKSDLQKNNSPMAIEMFEGLRIGDNYVWNLAWRKKVFGDLNLTINYFGRKVAEIDRVTHRGNIQLSALF